MAEEPRKTLGDYCRPRKIQSSIVLPPVDADVSFDLSSLIPFIQSYNQFGGLPSEDPKMHLHNFVGICDTLKCDALCDDGMRLRLFPFSLKDDASSWLRCSLPEQSITTWDQLATKFLEKYFPASKLAKLRRDILTFAQFESESLYEAKERFQDLLRRCPDHELPDWHRAHIFFEGLTPSNRSLLDVSIGGFLRENKPTQAYDLLGDMAFIKYQLQFDKLGMEKVSGVLATHTNTALLKQAKTMTNIAQYLITFVQKQQLSLPPPLMNDLCKQIGYLSTNCQEGNSSETEEFDFAGNSIGKHSRQYDPSGDY